MNTLTVRETTIDLPAHDPNREPLDALESGIGVLDSFRYADTTVRALDLEDLRLTDGEIRGIRADSGTWNRLRIDAVEITGCDLPSLTITESRFTRVKFTNCKFLGARFDNVTAEHVVFERCKLDYATIETLRAKGPVAFTHTVLRETRFVGSELTSVVFDQCEMHLTEFDRGNYRGMDLRENDLSTVRGITNLRGVKIREAQAIQLAHALTADLELDVNDDQPGGWQP